MAGLRKCQIIIFSVSAGARPAQIRIINPREKRPIIIVRASAFVFFAPFARAPPSRGCSGWRGGAWLRGSLSLIDWAFSIKPLFYDDLSRDTTVPPSPPITPAARALLGESRFYDFRCSQPFTRNAYTYNISSRRMRIA